MQDLGDISSLINSKSSPAPQFGAGISKVTATEICFAKDKDQLLLHIRKFMGRISQIPYFSL